MIVRVIALSAKPRKVCFKNDVITSDKYANELLEIKLDDLIEIKKSPYPIIGTGNIKIIELYILLIPVTLFFCVIPMLILYVVVILILLLKALFKKADAKLSLFPYMILFSENTNKLIHISLIDKDAYGQVRQYFIDTCEFDIDEAGINLHFTNFPIGDQHGTI